MPKRSRDGTVLCSSNNNIASATLALKACCSTSDSPFSAMDVGDVHGNPIPAFGILPNHVPSHQNPLSAASLSQDHNGSAFKAVGDRWKQTSLFGRAAPSASGSKEMDAGSSSGSASAASSATSCFFCELTIAVGQPVLLCSGCDHEYCSDCVIQDFTRNECVPYCHSCYSEKQRSRSLANGKF